MVEYVMQVAKAITGAIVALLGALSVVLVGDVGFGDITAGQWVAAAIAGLVALGAVWAIPNRSAKPVSAPPTASLKTSRK